MCFGSNSVWKLLVLSHAYCKSTDGDYLYTRSDDNLFNLSRLRAKTKIEKVFVRELLYADYAALVSQSESELQRMVDALADSCTRISLTTSRTETEVMGQGVSWEPVISASSQEGLQLYLSWCECQ